MPLAGNAVQRQAVTSAPAESLRGAGNILWALLVTGMVFQLVRVPGACLLGVVALPGFGV